MASFALLQGLSATTRLYWLRTPRMGGWIYGPYVNHNHYAGLMEMLVPIPLVFSLTRGARGPRKIMAGMAAALMASTIFLSGSRGGMLAFVVEMGIAGGGRGVGPEKSQDDFGTGHFSGDWSGTGPLAGWK